MKTILSFIFILFFSLSFAQKQDTLKSNRKNALKLYIDCDNCDIEHLKNEITIINYVRDRKQADVHLMITDMETGSGGTEYTLSFIGKNKFAYLTDTISFALPPNLSEEEERTAHIKKIKQGLTPFILKTPYAKKIIITYNDEDKQDTEIVEDNWKSWIAELSTSGYSNGEDSYTSYNTWSNIGISKVTPKIKITFNYHNNFSESVYRFETDTISSISRSNSGNFLITKSIGEHWAAGGFLNVYSSTFSNIELSGSIMPAVEYNVFKYSNSTTKQLRFLYKLGYTYNTYFENTIYDKTEEGLYSQNLNINFKLLKQWGSIEGSIWGKTFLHDFSKNNIGVHIGSSLRLFKGFSFHVNGGYSQKRNQISLPKEELSTEDMLLREKEMASNYNYWFNFGLSYTFGSIYNNVVNVRFDD